MTPIDLNAALIIAGDVLLDNGPPMLVLRAEPKVVDGRVRLTLLQGDGGYGLRIHRTYNPNLPLKVLPLGAVQALQEASALAGAVGIFLETQA